MSPPGSLFHRLLSVLGDGALTHADWSVFRTAIVALLVVMGCYLGAAAGTLLVFPRIGTAVLFPPYAVVTAALLLAPARNWWLIVLAGSLGTCWPNLAHEGDLSFVLLAEVA